MGAQHGCCDSTAVRPEKPVHRWHGKKETISRIGINFCLLFLILRYERHAQNNMHSLMHDACYIFLQVLDSPFSKLTDLMMEIVDTQIEKIRIPKPLMKVCVCPLHS